MRASLSATGRLFGRIGEREDVYAQLFGPHHRSAILAREALTLASRAENTDACFAALLTCSARACENSVKCRHDGRGRIHGARPAMQCPTWRAVAHRTALKDNARCCLAFSRTSPHAICSRVRAGTSFRCTGHELESVRKPWMLFCHH
jgi:hypothetical protein